MLRGRKMIERQILRVVYSPFRAFEEIVKNPVAKGPLLILALGVISIAIAGYVSSLKVHVQLNSDVGPYVPLVTTDVFGGHMLSIVIDAPLRLALTWFIYTGVMLLVVRVFGLSEFSWRALFFVIGYTFMAGVVGRLITALLICPLPTVQLGWGVWNPAEGMEDWARQKILEAYETWFSSPLYQFANYLFFVVEGWTAALAAIAIHAMFGTTWKKAVAISVIASIVAYMTRIVLLSL